MDGLSRKTTTSLELLKILHSMGSSSFGVVNGFDMNLLGEVWAFFGWGFEGFCGSTRFRLYGFEDRFGIYHTPSFLFNRFVALC